MNMGERITTIMFKKLIKNLTSATDNKITQMKEVNDKLADQKKVIDSLQHSFDFLYSKFDDMQTENEKIKEDVKTMKWENERLTKKMFDIEENTKHANIQLN